MSWWLSHKFEARRAALEMRPKMMRAIRSFFDEQGFIEVETPILQVCPGVDTHIHGLKTHVLGPDMATGRDFYLQTSPEFDMKRLLVAGMPKIYQICKVFRDGEGSKLHSPEFSMLEWYRAGADYRKIMDDSVDLLRNVAESLKIEVYAHGGKTADPFLNWNLISCQEAFDKYAKIDISEHLDDRAGFGAAIQEAGIRISDGDQWDDLFFRVMAEKIEPHLGMDVPCIFYDYPASMAALSRKKPENPSFAERFEIYVCGVELANAFSELTDAAEQRARITADMAKKRELYGFDYPVDEDFLKALEHGMPESGGIALGLDRLMMLATNVEDISQVLWAERL